MSARCNSPRGTMGWMSERNVLYLERVRAVLFRRRNRRERGRREKGSLFQGRRKPATSGLKKVMINSERLGELAPGKDEEKNRGRWSEQSRQSSQSMLSGNPSAAGLAVVLRCVACVALRCVALTIGQSSRNGTARQGGRSTRFELGLSTAHGESQSQARSRRVSRLGEVKVRSWVGTGARL